MSIEGDMTVDYRSYVAKKEAEELAKNGVHLSAYVVRRALDICKAASVLSSHSGGYGSDPYRFIEDIEEALREYERKQKESNHGSN